MLLHNGGPMASGTIRITVMAPYLERCRWLFHCTEAQKAALNARVKTVIHRPRLLVLFKTIERFPAMVAIFEEGRYDTYHLVI